MKKEVEEREVLSEEEKEEKKAKREEKVEKRKKAKKQDRMVRWSGIILFGILLIIGFLMWVAGEVKNEPGIRRPAEGVEGEAGEINRVMPSGSGQVGKVVVE